MTEVMISTKNAVSHAVPNSSQWYNKSLLDEETSPTTLLRSMLGLSEGADFAGGSLMEFVLLTEERVSAYDMEVLKVVRSKDVGRLRELHLEGRRLDACNRFGESLLHLACRRGNADMVAYMIREANVSPYLRDDYGRTPFHDACWTPTPQFHIMDILLEAAGPGLLLLKDVRGNTPFEYARREHRGEWIAFLKSREIQLVDPRAPIQDEDGDDHPVL